MERFGGYLLIQRLGSGGMGDVHLAHPASSSPEIPDTVIVKRLHAELLDHPTASDRFRQEAQVASQLDSPYVARVYEAGKVGKVLFYAGELVPGWSLDEFSLGLTKRIPIDIVSSIVRGAALGVRTLHEAVDPTTGATLRAVHRDLSPRNLMVDVRGRARVIDLGLLKATGRGWKTRTGMLLGTPGYMSPEQASALSTTPASDVYSLAVVYFEMLTGERYVRQGPALLDTLVATASPTFRLPSSLRPEIPVAIDDLLLAALSLDPGARPSMREVAEALGGLSSSEAAVEAYLKAHFPEQHAERLQRSKGTELTGETTEKSVGNESTSVGETFVRVQARHLPEASTGRPAQLEELTEPTAPNLPPPTPISRPLARGWPFALLVGGAVLVAAILSSTVNQPNVRTRALQHDESPEPRAIRAFPTSTPTATAQAPTTVPVKHLPPSSAPIARATPLRNVPQNSPKAAVEPASSLGGEVVAPTPTPALTFDALRARAKKLLSRAPNDSPVGRELEQLIVRLDMEARRRDAAAARRALDELEAQLRALEAKL